MPPSLGYKSPQSSCHFYIWLSSLSKVNFEKSLTKRRTSGYPSLAGLSRYGTFLLHAPTLESVVVCKISGGTQNLFCSARCFPTAFLFAVRQVPEDSGHLSPHGQFGRLHHHQQSSLHVRKYPHGRKSHPTIPILHVYIWSFKTFTKTILENTSHLWKITFQFSV